MNYTDESTKNCFLSVNKVQIMVEKSALLLRDTPRVFFVKKYLYYITLFDLLDCIIFLFHGTIYFSVNIDDYFSKKVLTFFRLQSYF